MLQPWRFDRWNIEDYSFVYVTFRSRSLAIKDKSDAIAMCLWERIRLKDINYLISLMQLDSGILSKKRSKIFYPSDCPWPLYVRGYPRNSVQFPIEMWLHSLIHFSVFLSIAEYVIGACNEEEEGAYYCCLTGRMRRRHVSAAHPPEGTPLRLRIFSSTKISLSTKLIMNRITRIYIEICIFIMSQILWEYFHYKRVNSEQKNISYIIRYAIKNSGTFYCLILLTISSQHDDLNFRVQLQRWERKRERVCTVGTRRRLKFASSRTTSRNTLQRWKSIKGCDLRRSVFVVSPAISKSARCNLRKSLFPETRQQSKLLRANKRLLYSSFLTERIFRWFYSSLCNLCYH